MNLQRRLLHSVSCPDSPESAGQIGTEGTDRTYEKPEAGAEESAVGSQAGCVDRFGRITARNAPHPTRSTDSEARKGKGPRPERIGRAWRHMTRHCTEL